MSHESFWNKNSETFESRGEEISADDQSQDSSQKALIFGPICILILYSKIRRWEKKREIGQVVKGNVPLFQLFSIQFQVANEDLLWNRQYKWWFM